MWCTCAYYAYITFCSLSIYVCIFCVCSVKGVRRKASKMTERRLFSWSITLGLDLTANEEKLPPFSRTQGKQQISHQMSTLLMPHQQLQLHLVLTLSLCNYFTSVMISTCRGYVFDSFIFWCVLGCHFI